MARKTSTTSMAKSLEIDLLGRASPPLFTLIAFYRHDALSPERLTLVTQLHAMIASLQYRHDNLKRPKRRTLRSND